VSTKKKTIEFDWPILHGTISTARAKCGTKTCRCQQDPEALHGPYYRWTGRLDGKITTKTLSREMAEECSRRIASYRKLQRQLESLLQLAIDSAPWNESEEE